MIRLSALTLLAAVVVAAPLAAQLPPVKEHTLSNGMRVLLVERRDDPTIACGWMARVGSVNERPGITGLAHLFEHMMFKGTKTIGTRNAKRDVELNEAQDRVQAQIREEMDQLRDRQRRGEIANFQDPAVRTPRLQELLDQFDALVKEQRSLVVKDEIWTIYAGAGGTGMNASTSQDLTQYIVTIPSNKLELWAWLESDRLANPVFREFYSERNVILEERKQTLESRPGGLVSEAFNAMTWMAHPYHWQVIGWPSDISQVTREDANAFFATYYAPNNITAILVGDFKADQVLPVLERYFGRIPANPRGVPPVITQEPTQPAEQRMIASVETSPSVEVVFKTVAGLHKDAPALQVLASVLSGSGGGMMMRGTGGSGRASGRLGRGLVLEQKAALSASAFSRGQKYAGTFVLRATPAPGKRPEDVEPLLYAEMAKIAQEGITEAELERAKNAYQMTQYARMDNNVAIRSALTAAESSGSWRDLEQAPKRMLAVTREDVQRVVRQYFTQENRSVLITLRKGKAGPRFRPNAPTVLPEVK